MPCNTGPPPRRPDPLTGFDARDDLPLRNLTIRPGKPWDELKDLPEGRRPYRGPFLLLNTAMNLVRGDELAWQERMAEAFVLSPWYCGSRTTGYRPARAYAGGLTLGTAVAISGAAVAPNMGYHSSPAVTALLTIFNVRLGGWFGNPKRDKWKRSDPSGLRLLWRELTGDTRADRKYVYLSDGGHFDDLGVYELVRRHCRYIVACDGGADPEYGFGDLGGLIRKCRSDLGVPIEIDVQPIRPRLGRGHSKWHCAVGRIRYDCIDPAAEPGLLLYIKTSLTGDEPCDVLNYAIEHGPFPHQSTLNQFFEESQFESYRALGQHVGLEVFGAAARDADIDDAMSDETHRRIAGRLFANLRRRWFAAPRDEKSPPAGLHADFRSNDGLLTV